MGIVRRVAGVVLVAGVCLVALAPDASAHALLRSSEPSAGEQVDRPPDEVTLVFTEDPEPSLSVVHVLDTAGQSFERSPPQRVPGDARSLRVVVRGLSQGVYTVTWRVVSRVDGHATAGSFAFGVGVPVTSTPNPRVTVTPETPPVSGLEIAGRFALFLGLVGLIGGAWTAALASVGSTSKQIVRFAFWAALVAVPGVVLLAIAQWRASAGSGAEFTVFLGTPLGRAIVWRTVAIVGALVALVAARRTSDGTQRRWLWLAAVAGAGLAFAHVEAGHAGAASPRAVEILAQWVHVVTASIWVGGLAALLLAVRGAPSEEKAAAVRRFSTVAGVAIVVVAATGIVRALGQLHRFSDLWDSAYGLVVLAKAGLILILAGLGAMNRYGTVPKADHDLSGLRRVSRNELVIMAATLAFAAGLASLAPPPPKAEAALKPAVVATGTDFGTSVRVRLAVQPGTAGPNQFELTVRDYDTAEVITNAIVSLRFTYLDDPRVGATTLVLKRAGSVYRASGLNLSLAGRWRVGALIVRGTDSFEVELRVATRCVTTATPGGDFVIYDIPLGALGKAQGYVDPGRAGQNEVHVTFFGPDGNELPAPGAIAMRASSGDRLVPLTARRLSPGHFVADAQLTAGAWRFDFAGTDAKGNALRGCFSDTVRG
jgi:copper transport protein